MIINKKAILIGVVTILPILYLFTPISFYLTTWWTDIYHMPEAKKHANNIYEKLNTFKVENGNLPSTSSMNNINMDYFKTVSYLGNRLRNDPNCDGIGGFGCKSMEIGITDGKFFIYIYIDLNQCYREEDWNTWVCRVNN